MQRPARAVTGKPKNNYKTPYERIPGTNLPRIPKGTRLGGREKGRQNHLSMTVKEAVSDGAASCGYDGKGKDGLVGYMKRLAEKEPVAFTTLLKAIIPLQLQASIGLQDMNPDEGQTLTIEELELRLKARGLRPMIDITPPPGKPKVIEGSKS